MSRPTTLRQQLLMWLAVPLGILWSISTAIDYDAAKRFGNFAYDRALLESALDIGRQVKVLNGRVYVDLPEVAVQMLQSHETGRIWYRVTDPRDEFVTGEPDLPRPLEPASDRVSYYDAVYQSRPVRVVALTLPIDSGGVKGNVSVHVAEASVARDDLARQLMLRMAVPQGLLILLVGLALWFAVGRGLKPLAELRSEVEARSHRDLSPLSEARIPQEVQPLIHAINDLLTRLHAVLASRSRFVADAAHQLRTPVAGMKTQAELALRTAPPGDGREALQKLQKATENSTRLINQLLALARAEPGAEQVQQPRRVDLSALAQAVTTDWVPRALDRNVDLGYDGDEHGLQVDGDPFLLGEMLNNLLDNAIRYTPPGGQVTVRVLDEKNSVALTVEDNGPGVPDGERERVFERFYRVLGTGADGCGLGLAIVREIAESHGGSAAMLAGANGTGCLVRITLPKAA